MTITRRGRRDPATIARNGARTAILVLFAIFFATPLVWLVLATTKNGDQLVSGAPLSWGSIHQLISNWHRLVAFDGGAYAGWFRHTLVYAGSALVLVLLVDIPAGYGLAIAGARIRRPLLG